MGNCLSPRKQEEIQKEINVREIFGTSHILQKPDFRKLKNKKKKDKKLKKHYFTKPD
jgi:hypothetical protein